MEPYVPNKHLNTPQRKHIIDLNVMQGDIVSQIKIIINVPTSTIK